MRRTPPRLSGSPEEGGSDDLRTAVTLMRMALALLDRAGDPSFAAARLQHAIDTAVGRRSGRRDRG